MHDYAKVNRQALQLTVAAYLLIAALALGVLTGSEMVKQFVATPLITGVVAFCLGRYGDLKHPWPTKLSDVQLGRVLNGIWLFYPLAIALYASSVILLTGSYDDLHWVGPCLGIPLGHQVALLFVE